MNQGVDSRNKVTHIERSCDLHRIYEDVVSNLEKW